MQSLCLHGVLVVPLLASILGSWHRGSWCNYSICAIYGCLAIWQPHQRRWPSSYSSSREPFPQSCPRWATKLRVRLQKYICLSAGIFSLAQMYYHFGYLDITVFRVISLTYFITTMVCYSTFLCRLMSSTKFSLVSGHRVKLSNYILCIRPKWSLVTPYYDFM